jgi:hypothetical protein
MLETTNDAGQALDHNPATAGLEEGALGEESTTHQDTWKQDLEARMDLMMDGIGQLTSSVGRIAQYNQAPVQQEVEDIYDDDEPLTASRVGKIVNKAVNSAVNTSNEQSTRREWDTKARKEFPISDPKFEAQFNKEWKSFQDAGGNINHPRAVHKICSDTARILGIGNKTTTRRSAASAEPTGESPSQTGVQTSRRAANAKILDTDPRVEFYRLRNSDPKAVEAFKKTLEDKANTKRRGAR